MCCAGGVIDQIPGHTVSADIACDDCSATDHGLLVQAKRVLLSLSALLYCLGPILLGILQAALHSQQVLKVGPHTCKLAVIADTAFCFNVDC